MNIPATVKLCRAKVDAMKAMERTATPAPWDGKQIRSGLYQLEKSGWHQNIAESDGIAFGGDGAFIAAFRNLAPGMLAYLEANLEQCEFDPYSNIESLLAIAAALGQEVVE